MLISANISGVLENYYICQAGRRGPRLGLNSTLLSADSGCRPIICLKTNVFFHKASDGVYTISY